MDCFCGWKNVATIIQLTISRQVGQLQRTTTPHGSIGLYRIVMMTGYFGLHIDTLWYHKHLERIIIVSIATFICLGWWCRHRNSDMSSLPPAQRYTHDFDRFEIQFPRLYIYIYMSASIYHVIPS
jgi:hypothetical protein